MSHPQVDIAHGLASALLAGEWARPEMLFRASDALGFGGQWLRRLVHDVLLQFPTPPRDAHEALARFICAHEAFQEAWQQRWLRGQLRRWYLDTPAMREPRWPVRRLDTLGDVADWLGLDSEHLDWLADRKGLEHTEREPRLQNYRYTWVAKPSGGGRLLEAPKARLKAAQRRIARDILEALPVHPAAHGFCRGRSVLSHARLHVGQATVIHFDLRAFFADVSTARAHGVFRAAGYPEEVARTLLGLCTNRVPLAVLRQAPRPSSAKELEALVHLRRRLSAHHLPQGAPTSPAIANLCAHALDVRLTALAESLGAVYSRYADDLTFSGGRALAGARPRLERWVGALVHEEGFSLNRHKTRVMRASGRQSVTGIVVNQRPNLSRAEYDALKAVVHNCVRHGPMSQARGRSDFQSYLRGRIAWATQLHPERGAKLQRLFDAVDWEGAGSAGSAEPEAGTARVASATRGADDTEGKG